MKSETARLVHETITYALDLKARLERGENASIATEQAALQGLIQSETETRGRGDAEFEQDVRYALVAWLDELFVLDSPWAAEWNERKIESAMFGTNDRAWKFWEKARRALARGDLDLLETCYLCVMLGFRGELRGIPDELEAWTTTARAQIEKESASAWTPPPDVEPPTRVPPLHGRAALRLMVLRSAVAVMILFPLAAVLIVLQLNR